jgi:hypothetical protein
MALDGLSISGSVSQESKPLEVNEAARAGGLHLHRSIKRNPEDQA